jgi:hypothetical protein
MIYTHVAKSPVPRVVRNILLSVTQQRISVGYRNNCYTVPISEIGTIDTSSTLKVSAPV